jgi:iron complex transport system ATP-binding protein
MTCGTQAVSLDMEQVSWGPSRDRAIISEISLSIAAGARLAVIGANGAGKSSLLRCIFRAAKPVEGRVFLDGEDIWSLGSRAVARKVAAVLQETPSDFPFTVLDIVLMGRIPHCRGLASWSDRDRDAAQHALSHLGLSRFAERAFSTLSGGERQRVLIARALAQEPGLIVLDEPTNHLDIRHQLEILHRLKSLPATVVTALHDINLAADFADFIALMSQGRLMAFGPPAEVLTSVALSSAFSVTADQLHAGPSRGPRFFFSLSDQPHNEDMHPCRT